MRKFKRVLLYTLSIIVLVIALSLTYVKTMLPNVGSPPEITVDVTKDRVMRGEYLANHVAVCIDCHSQRDWSLFSGPPIENTIGMGGEVFDQNMGFPGKYVSRNITPAALKNWSDGEIFRAITSGVDKDGNALFSIMPHHNFGKLSEDDIHSLIAYLRTLEPIENTPEKSKSDFPMNFIINTIPKKAELKQAPPKSNKILYGKYLVTAASCYDCHTNQLKGRFIGDPFAGGMEFKFPNGTIVRSSNITPHETGLKNWSVDDFVNKFKYYQEYPAQEVKPGEFQTVMPWTMYSGMDTYDLEAIYAYLQNLEEFENQVERFTFNE